MATLVLSAVGQAVAGPIGSAIGAMAGQAIDAKLFAPEGRRGPRLDDLRVQTSSYGTPIAKVWGRMRVAGTVVWADELTERRRRAGGGKGQPKSTTYTYSASFAVALSGRPVRAVGRIWADGKLLRGGAGDLKTRVTVRLHGGGEDQPTDPLIAAREGRAPAHRGVALLVFEDLELADFGNRIPSITVEMDADGAVDPHLVAGELGGFAAAPSGVALAGYAVAGGRVGDIVDEVRALTGAPLREADGALALGAADGVSALPAQRDRVAGEDEATERRAEAALPTAAEIGYFDPARDFQAGLQRAGEGTRVDALAAPAAMAAEQAAALAAARLERLRAARERRRVVLGPEWMGVAPGAVVRLPDAPGRWLVRAAALERMLVKLELEPAPDVAVIPMAGGDAGRASAAPDLSEGTTTLHLLDLPGLPGERVTSPRLLVAAAGTGEGWRGAALEASVAGAGWAPAGETAAPAMLGRVVAAPPPGAAELWDREGALVVELLHGGMWLESRDEAAVLAGDNLAAVGGELIGFARAEPLGGARWRLSGLLRGRFGTEARAGIVGDPFTLLEAEALASIAVPAGGGDARVLATGRTGRPVEELATVSGAAVRPLPPCHLRAERLADGAVALSWIRRSREGWAWLDGLDAPLGEEREMYRVSIGARIVEVGEPRWTYEAAEQMADGVAGPLRFAVAQVGAQGVSRAATTEILGG